MALVPGGEKLRDVAHLWSSAVKWEVGRGSSWKLPDSIALGVLPAQWPKP